MSLRSEAFGFCDKSRSLELLSFSSMVKEWSPKTDIEEFKSLVEMQMEIFQDRLAAEIFKAQRRAEESPEGAIEALPMSQLVGDSVAFSLLLGAYLSRKGLL